MTVTTGSTRADEARVDRAPVRPRRRSALVLGGALLALVAAVLTGIWIGAFPLPPGAVVLTLVDRVTTALGGGHVSGGLDATGTAVLLQLRLPRVLLARSGTDDSATPVTPGVAARASCTRSRSARERTAV